MKIITVFQIMAVVGSVVAGVLFIDDRHAQAKDVVKIENTHTKDIADLEKKTVNSFIEFNRNMARQRLTELRIQAKFIPLKPHEELMLEHYETILNQP